ncbi:MAG: hypothetical protein IJ467_05825 [Bacteroidaceae bacterium]|nr:hypothetical protein [Bacteroidaceae bacterium]
MKKSNVQVVVAIVVLATGVVLSYVDYFSPPSGEIAASVLDYLRHTMFFAGSVLGVKNYVDYRICHKKEG